MPDTYTAYDRDTGASVLEFYNPALIAMVNKARYGVATAREYLYALNDACKAAGGVQPPRVTVPASADLTADKES